MKLFQVDSFTSSMFSGNPAGVAMVEDFPDTKIMQNIAMEMNLSETAFIQDIGDGNYKVRFFTPEEEVDLCGHASLACAHIYFSQNLVSSDETICFHTKGGRLDISNKNGKYSMTFPRWGYSSIEDIEKAQSITEINNIEEIYDTDKGWRILIVKDVQTLKDCQPNFSKMKGTEYGNIAVTCKGESKYDYVMRCFVTDCGINEDPVTGSIECIIAPLWSEKLEKKSMKSYQASARGGEKFLEVQENSIVLSGNAITVLEIQLLSNDG